MIYGMLIVIFNIGFLILGYMLGKREIVQSVKETKETTKEIDEELERLKAREKSFNKLMSYNEDIATRGYKE